MDDPMKLSFEELVERGANDVANTLPITAAILAHPDLATIERRRDFARILLTDSRFRGPKPFFGPHARLAVVNALVRERDAETLALVATITSDAAHPLHREQVLGVLSSRHPELIEPLHAQVLRLLEAEPLTSTTRFVIEGAVFAMGAEAVFEDLVPRYLTRERVMMDGDHGYRAGSILFELAHQMSSGCVRRDHRGLAEAILAIEDLKPVAKACARLRKLLDPTVLAAVGGAPPASGRTAKKSASKTKSPRS